MDKHTVIKFMKKLIALIGLAVASVTAQAQTVEQIAVTIQVSVATNASTTVYTVAVPNAANSALSSAKKPSETQEAYVKRAFVYGANGLIQEKATTIARRDQLAAAVKAANDKLK